ALGQAEIHPVGGAVAGSAKAGYIDQGFQQERSDLVTRPPIVWQLTSDTRQDVARQMIYMNPGENQKPAVIDHLRQVGAASNIVPTDPTIARRHFPRRTGEQQATQQRLKRGGGSNKIAKLCTVWDAIGEVVISVDMLSEQCAIGVTVDQLQTDRL